jgi:hypothetical protein
MLRSVGAGSFRRFVASSLKLAGMNLLGNVLILFGLISSLLVPPVTVPSIDLEFSLSLLSFSFSSPDPVLGFLVLLRVVLGFPFPLRSFPGVRSDESTPGVERSESATLGAVAAGAVPTILWL